MSQSEDLGRFTCEACGQHHGPIGVEMHCLRKALQAARKEIRDLKQEIVEIRSLLATIPK